MDNLTDEDIDSIIDEFIDIEVDMRPGEPFDTAVAAALINPIYIRTVERIRRMVNYGSTKRFDF